MSRSCTATCVDKSHVQLQSSCKLDPLSETFRVICAIHCVACKKRSGDSDARAFNDMIKISANPNHRRVPNGAGFKKGKSRECSGRAEACFFRASHYLNHVRWQCGIKFDFCLLKRRSRLIKSRRLFLYRRLPRSEPGNWRTIRICRLESVRLVV